MSSIAESVPPAEDGLGGDALPAMEVVSAEPPAAPEAQEEAPTAPPAQDTAPAASADAPPAAADSAALPVDAPQASRAPPAPAKQNKELKVEDALHYLDQVKLEFSDKPHIYNEFLEIMKNFKAQSINTPGVITRVKNLFRGYNKLILGFNTFLPEGDGYKIELSPEEEAMSCSPQHGGSEQPAEGADEAFGANPMAAVPSATKEGAAAAAGGGTMPQHMQQQHAIAYVTTIRNRFSNEPETYRQFLKILHTYQKEQKGIKEVLEQVSHLFADHPDLLMEFTYFLPDAVQDQAKERLHRAVREAELRRAQMMHQQQAGGDGKKRARDSGGGAGNARNQKQRLMQQQQQAMDMQHSGLQGHMAQMQSRAGMPPYGHMGAMAQYPAAMGAMMGPGGMMPGGFPINRMAMGGPDGYPPAKTSNKNNKRRAGAGPSGMPGPGMDHMGAYAGSMMPTGTQTARLHSLTAERRFFEQVKDIISSSSRDSWTEFVKCLELFSNDFISRKDMFTLVQDLFGPAHQTLFEEFKALLFRRTAYDSSAGDMWYAVPLSEIDFSQCLKCTPSYRALPKDYPPALCSDRGPLEASVLNDQWVSIPIGSEESYSFKHMRKNQYEEALFKCEDDRFEIDMLIDTNMSTIRILEPLNEEIQHIKQLEESDAGCPKFNFQLEKRHLSTVHLNCITRLYGEFATEILELLRKNPVGAIPVILKRLKQKDLEWRKARQELTKTWKEVLAANTERSLDHRSFYHRQQDKRTYNAKHLVNDIKIIGTNPDATTPPELVPLGVICPVSGDNALLQLCGKDLQPCNLMMNFDNEGRGIHRDIYRIFSHATEMSNMHSGDKERISALWRDFTRVFFDLPVHFMYSGPAAEAANNLRLPEDHPHYALHRGEGSDGEVDVMPSWEIGTMVLTLYGVGKVTGFRAEDGMHSVRLPFGNAYMRSSCILGAEQLSTAALQAIGVSRDAHGRDTILSGLKVPPAQNEVPVERPQELFFGTQMCYVFLRLYHTIYVRLLEARRLAEANADALSRNTSSMPKYDAPDEDTGYIGGHLASPRSAPATAAVTGGARGHRSDAYSCVLSHVVAMVDGSLETNRFEDHCRQLLGNQSFFLYTIDKVLQQAMKCLQAMANDETVTKLIGVYLYHRNRAPKRGVAPSLYKAHVAFVLSNTMEEVFRLQYITSASGETRGLSGVACQCLGALSFDLSTVDAATIGTVATPRGAITPKAASGDMDTGGPDSATSSAVKAPQLILPDADENSDESSDGSDGEEEEEEQPAARRATRASRGSAASTSPGGLGDNDPDDDLDGEGEGSAMENGAEDEDGSEDGSERPPRRSGPGPANSRRGGDRPSRSAPKPSGGKSKDDASVGDPLDVVGLGQESGQGGQKSSSNRRSGGSRKR